MHDHNIINYNQEFVFQNLECIAHLQRDLQKNVDETGHDVLLEIKELISSTIKDRKNSTQNGKEKFDDKYVKTFEDKLTKLLNEAEQTANKNISRHTGNDERALVKRITAYRSNYLLLIQ